MNRSVPHIDERGRFVHWCMHPGCTVWGSAGSGCNLLKFAAAVRGREPDAQRWAGTWYCPQHAPKRAAPAAQPAKTTLAGPSPGQGTLF